MGSPVILFFGLSNTRCCCCRLLSHFVQSVFVFSLNQISPFGSSFRVCVSFYSFLLLPHFWVVVFIYSPEIFLSYLLLLAAGVWIDGERARRMSIITRLFFLFSLSSSDYYSLINSRQWPELHAKCRLSCRVYDSI